MLAWNEFSSRLLFLVESLPIIMLLFFASERLLTEGLTAGAEQG